MNTNNENNATKMAKQNKALKIIVIILLIVSAFAIATAHSYKTQLRMNQYAIMNDCEWHYSYFINEEPQCK